jgi:DNA-binding Lrp family transcriptional regulator
MLTRKDEELIALLKLNARDSVASLARKLGLSRTTVQDRLKRLEEQKVIEGYSVKLSEGVKRDGISAYVSLSVEPRRAVDVMSALSAISQIEALYSVSGKFDILALVTARSTEGMDKLLDQVGQISGVTRTESAIILSTKLDRR